MRFAAFFFFFLSGITGLVLETVWFRELALIFGSGTWAAGTVTAAFLGGLGLGGLTISFFADRLKRHLLVYGLLESFVGVYSLLTPAILRALDAFQYDLTGGEAVGATAYAIVRFFLVFLALLPATLAMGATLPLLVRAVTRTERGAGTGLGLLYGLNTFGAFSGVLFAGFALLPALGQSLTLRLAAVSILFVGILAASAGLFHRSGALSFDSAGASRPAAARPVVLLTFFVFFSGFAAMLVQVGFVRLFAIVLGSSVYSFSLTVAVFLFGIAAGSLIYAAFSRTRIDAYRMLSVAQGVLAFFLAAGIFLADRLPLLLLAFLRGGEVNEGSFYLFQGLMGLLVLGVPTLAMGFSFPCAIRILAGPARHLGQDVGRAYFVNTLGAILGSFTAAFLLIPHLGLQTTLAYAAGLSIVWAALFSTVREGALYPKRLRYAAPLAFLAVTLFHQLPHWNVALLTSGFYRVGLTQRLAPGEDPPLSAILYYRDGPLASVSVERREGIKTMRINGKVEASNRFDMPTQALVGLLPLLLHESDRNHEAALVGFGSGVTAGAMLSTPLAHLTAIELEPRVLEAAQLFNDVNFHPFRDPRLNLVEGDARTVLSYADKRYDVIVSEPSNPWVSGASGLFTTDFYRLMHDRLTDNGVFSQWIQLYELSPENLRTLVRSFKWIFPNSLVFSTSERGVDLLLVGKKTSWKLDLPRILERARLPRVQEVLKASGVMGGYDLLSLLAVTSDELETFVGPGPLNTDDNGLIEFAAPRDILKYREYALAAVNFHFDEGHGDLLPFLDNLGENDEERSDHLSRLALHLLARGRTTIAYKIAEKALGLAPNALASEVEDVCKWIYLEMAKWPPVRSAWMLAEGKGEDYAALAILIGQGEVEAAYKQATALAASDPDPRLAYVRGALALINLQFDVAEPILTPLAADEAFRATTPEVDFYAGRALDRRMKFAEAVRHLARFNLWRRQNDHPHNFDLEPDQIRPPEDIEIVLEVAEDEEDQALESTEESEMDGAPAVPAEILREVPKETPDETAPDAPRQP